MLKKVAEKARAKGFRILNIDATVTAQEPRLAEYIPMMIRKIGDVLEIGTDRINVKATNPEGLGFSGRGEGILGQSVVLVEGNPDVEDL